MKIVHRIYDNFLRKSRFDIYNQMLKYAIERGYKFYTIEEFNHIIKDGALNPDMKYAIIRHDIDTDPLTAYELFKIEKKYCISSTYYFRLNTINDCLIKEMTGEGQVEIAYHYEEIASYAKKHKLKSKEDIDKHIKYIRNLFLENLTFFRKRCNVSSRTIASHGDFVNKYLGLPNWYLCNNEVRERGGIEVEAYDSSFMEHVTCRIADLGNIDDIWTPFGFYESIEKNEKVIYILIHPRQWYSRVSSNLKADCIRIKEGLLYQL